MFGGAPPEGTCVADCSEASDACDRFANAICVGIGVGEDAKPDGLCFERCELGGAADSDKCHGREHIACAPVDDQAKSAAFCRPLCANDDECASGACDPAHGVCVAKTVADRDFGLRCGDGGSEVDAGANAQAECAGLCVQLNSAPQLCSRRCVFGSPDECAPASGGLRRGGCLFASEGGGIGDVGYCGELCDCNDDCIEPTFVCDAFEDKNLEGAFGRKGVCTDAKLVINEPLPCPK